MVGTSVGPYQILEKLGSGGMGEVFLCHDSRLQRNVALKCLTIGEPGAADESNILREARAAARLTHPHIASVYDVLEHEGRAFIVMEYVEGESLRRRLIRGALSADQAIAIGRQLASALAAAHAQGVIHRDLKPSNVQVMPDGTIKVLDFGVAKVMPRLESVADAPTTRRTAAGERAGSPGTPVYMAPEQLIGGRVDARSDIYSLGVVLFEIVTGRRPYLQNDAVGLAVAMSTSPPPPPDAIDPRVPRGLSSVIVKALQREPFDRYQSVQELGAALEELSEPTTREVIGLPVPIAWHRRGWLLAGAAVVLIAIGAAVWRPLLTRAGMLKPVGGSAQHAALAILPVDNQTGDVQVEYLGAGIAATVATNFAGVSGLIILARSATAAFQDRRNDLAAIERELAATHVLDLTMRGSPPRPVLAARLRRPGASTDVWAKTIEGDSVVIEQTLLESLGRALEREGAFSKRLTAADWTRIRRLPTTNADALAAYSEARALLDQPELSDNRARAVAMAQRAIASDSGFALGYAALGDAYWSQYQSDKDPALVGKATDAVMQALRIDPNQAPVHYSLGNMRYLTGHLDEAASSLRRALALQPDSDDAHRLLGRVIADQGHVDDAVKEIGEAIKIRPNYWNNHYTLGFVLYRTGRYAPARDAFRRASELQPASAIAFQMIGTTSYILGEIDTAIGNYEHSVRVGPTAAAYANLAYVYYYAKRYDEALAAYSESLRRSPKSVVNHRNIGDVYERLGRLGEARKAYEEAIRLANEQLTVNPRDVVTIGTLAICEAKLERRSAAERHAAEAVSLAPTNADAWLRSASVHAILKQTQAGLDDLRRAIANGLEPRRAREDDTLQPLRTRPEFEQLLRAAEQTKVNTVK